jgi:tetratricopeptide (TPR) repeat protein
VVFKIIMRSPEEADRRVCVCANCGVAEVDEIKLEDCDVGYAIVKYCSDKCKEEHREQHGEEYNKRSFILHDKRLLFKQPDGSHIGECPLCFLPMPLDPQKSTFKSCCSNLICNGCEYAHQRSNGGDNCPFCREPLPEDDEENKKMIMERVKANDPVALCQMGTRRKDEGDWDSAVKYWTKAAELGDAVAHYQLADSYHDGKGVEKDEEKDVYHLEKAAIGGHPLARYNLACVEHENGNMERAVKHLIIAANLGHELSMKELWECYKDGNITKGELEATLRTHKAAIDEMKSPAREAAEADSEWLMNHTS